MTSIVALLLISMMGYRFFFGEKEYILEEKEEYMQQVISEESSEDYSQAIIPATDTKVSERLSEVTVYVSGAVQESKVVTLENGKRLIDAVEACGGLTEDADLNRINLSLKLEEEKHYVIPKIGEDLPEEISSLEDSAQQTERNQQINLNTASIEQLKTLPGIGDVLAQRILDKKTELGSFHSVEDLLNVSGIGEKKFNDIKNLVCVR